MDFTVFSKTQRYNTFDDFPAQMIGLYHAMHGDGLLRSFFYFLPHEPSIPEFMDTFARDDAWLYLACDQSNIPLAFALCDDFQGKSAKVHFGFLPAGMPHRHEFARYFIDQVCPPGSDTGLSTLIGLTPAPYSHAWRFALDVGFRRVTTIKDGCEMYRSNGERVYRDAVITQYDRSM